MFSIPLPAQCHLVTLYERDDVRSRSEESLRSLALHHSTASLCERNTSCKERTAA